MVVCLANPLGSSCQPTGGTCMMLQKPTRRHFLNFRMAELQPWHAFTHTHMQPGLRSSAAGSMLNSTCCGHFFHFHQQPLPHSLGVVQAPTWHVPVMVAAWPHVSCGPGRCLLFGCCVLEWGPQDSVGLCALLRSPHFVSTPRSTP